MSVVGDMQQDKGLELAELLGLRKTHKADPDSEARYDLDTGSKTDLGLYLTVREFIIRAEIEIRDEDEAVAKAMVTTKETKERLEYLRGEIEAERISIGEVIELQSLVDHIEPDDVLLLEWAGAPEPA